MTLVTEICLLSVSIKLFDFIVKFALVKRGLVFESCFDFEKFSVFLIFRGVCHCSWSKEESKMVGKARFLHHV